MDLLKTLGSIGLIPVIKLNDAADAVPLCRALADGGLPVAEITFRTAAAEESIKRVAAELPNVILGAGTVLNTEQVDKAVAAGAKYIVSPGLNPKIVKHCQAIGVPVLPGCSSPSDIEAALELGLKTVKFFPAESLGGLQYIKALAAPYTDVTFVPTGGISEKNLTDYMKFPKVLACGGSWMAKDDLIEKKDWGGITKIARQAVQLVHGFDLIHIGINETSADGAIAAAKTFERLFGWTIKDNNASTFAGTIIEVMKPTGRGKMGHIAVGVNNMERAVAYLASVGVKFIEETLSGKAVYLDMEISGFAVHLLQK
ncbi:MAG: bifunctional 4-hydroxy-2-oxoglutarate aldolase/2-dehydro-3-deoxy-phosphogluconate aldolase [Oscillospiraceae bacterium]|jgi:2-dehydro-3-deoxyphosphogluconate aldolase/(4S)-4-hydroxy-2-oxoglutarate aldolase|nr:bifunctional 4-hydroxy-2-oxoglutarate aldolase/2-dehydro-3-deoxy-phosphogluconate aldolase [Oscillospiraceae bacterium]